MTKIHRRKGNRVATGKDTTIVITVYGKRLEGKVLDESKTGVLALLPSDCGLQEQQLVRFQYRRARHMATVARLEPVAEGDRVGLRFSATGRSA